MNDKSDADVPALTLTSTDKLHREFDGIFSPETVPEVLFVCVHNAGRSQMAAALLDARSRGNVHVRSAGSAPAGSINAVVVRKIRDDIERRVLRLIEQLRPTKTTA